MVRSSNPPAEAAGTPAPRANPLLVGHETVEQMLRALLVAGRVPHALLLCGPPGIGKATFAFRLARFVLAQGGEVAADREPGKGLAIDPDSGVFRRVAGGGHADLLTVERAYDPRRRRLRSEIVVDDAREIAAFLRLTPAEDGWRVVVVDGADAMNRSAANALLKILEEPPRRALLLLVADSPGRLLPTIRSRCWHLPLAALRPEIVRHLLGYYRPDLDPTEAEAVVGLAGGSIGRALDLAASGGVELYRTILALLARPQGLDTAVLHGFADRMVRADAEESYRIVEELLSLLLARTALAAAQVSYAMPQAGLLAAEHAVVLRLHRRAPAAHWAELRDEIGRGFGRTNGLNLDRKQQLLGAFFAIERTAE